MELCHSQGKDVEEKESSILRQKATREKNLVVVVPSPKYEYGRDGITIGNNNNKSSLSNNENPEKRNEEGQENEERENEKKEIASSLLSNDDNSVDEVKTCQLDKNDQREQVQIASTTLAKNDKGGEGVPAISGDIAIGEVVQESQPKQEQETKINTSVPTEATNKNQRSNQGKEIIQQQKEGLPSSLTHEVLVEQPQQIEIKEKSKDPGMTMDATSEGKEREGLPLLSNSGISVIDVPATQSVEEEETMSIEETKKDSSQQKEEEQHKQSTQGENHIVNISDKNSKDGKKNNSTTMEEANHSNSTAAMDCDDGGGNNDRGVDGNDSGSGGNSEATESQRNIHKENVVTTSTETTSKVKSSKQSIQEHALENVTELKVNTENSPELVTPIEQPVITMNQKTIYQADQDKQKEMDDAMATETIKSLAPKEDEMHNENESEERDGNEDEDEDRNEAEDENEDGNISESENEGTDADEQLDLEGEDDDQNLAMTEEDTKNPDAECGTISMEVDLNPTADNTRASNPLKHGIPSIFQNFAGTASTKNSLIPNGTSFGNHPTHQIPPSAATFVRSVRGRPFGGMQPRPPIMMAPPIPLPFPPHHPHAMQAEIANLKILFKEEQKRGIFRLQQLTKADKRRSDAEEKYKKERKLRCKLEKQKDKECTIQIKDLTSKHTKEVHALEKQIKELKVFHSKGTKELEKQIKVMTKQSLKNLKESEKQLTKEFKKQQNNGGAQMKDLRHETEKLKKESSDLKEELKKENEAQKIEMKTIKDQHKLIIAEIKEKTAEKISQQKNKSTEVLQKEKVKVKEMANRIKTTSVEYDASTVGKLRNEVEIAKKDKLDLEAKMRKERDSHKEYVTQKNIDIKKMKEHHKQQSTETKEKAAQMLAQFKVKSKEKLQEEKAKYKIKSLEAIQKEKKKRQDIAKCKRSISTVVGHDTTSFVEDYSNKRARIVGEEALLTPQSIEEKASKHMMKWMQRFHSLQVFKTEFEHCNVQKMYFRNPDGTADEEKRLLFNFVNSMRSHHKHLREGKPHSLTSQKIQLLESIGFKWRTTPEQLSWEERIKQLADYVTEHGNCNVPQGYKRKGCEGLGNFILTQRRQYREGRIDPSKAMQLEQLGFQWTLRDRGGTLQERMVRHDLKKGDTVLDVDQLLPLRML